MKDAPLEAASEIIYKNLLLGKEVSNDIVLEFIYAVKNCITANPKEIPPSFYRLSGYINDMVQSAELTDASVDIALTYGKLWSIVNLVEMAEHDELSKRSIEEDAIRFQNRYELFKIIKNNYGIAHNDLANYAKISVSALSQFMGKMENGRYVFYRQFGRNKYYYITDSGAELIKKIEENNQLKVQTQRKESTYYFEEFIGRFLVKGARENRLNEWAPVMQTLSIEINSPKNDIVIPNASDDVRIAHIIFAMMLMRDDQLRILASCRFNVWDVEHQQTENNYYSYDSNEYMNISEFLTNPKHTHNLLANHTNNYQRTEQSQEDGWHD